MMALGELTVFAPEAMMPPPRLAKALTVIGSQLRGRLLIEGYATKDSCILTALVVRDVLLEIGFHDAQVLPVTFIVRATDARGMPLHSLAVGESFNKDAPGRWVGHLVTVMRHTGWLIDPTLEQARRPQWPMLTAQAAVPLRTPVRLRKQTRPIAGFALEDGATGRKVEATWLAMSGRGDWQNAPDSIASRRGPVVRALVAHCPPWHPAEQ